MHMMCLEEFVYVQAGFARFCICKIINEIIKILTTSNETPSLNFRYYSNSSDCLTSRYDLLLSTQKYTFFKTSCRYQKSRHFDGIHTHRLTAISKFQSSRFARLLNDIIANLIVNILTIHSSVVQSLTVVPTSLI